MLFPLLPAIIIIISCIFKVSQKPFRINEVANSLPRQL